MMCVSGGDRYAICIYVASAAEKSKYGVPVYGIRMRALVLKDEENSYICDY